MEEAPISLRVTAKKEASQLDFESRRLRWMCVLLAACQAVLFLLLAVANYPFIVIADSGLGVDAMARVDGWLRLAGACLLAGVVIAVGNCITWLAARLALTVALLILFVRLALQSPGTPLAAQMAFVALAGLLLAADCLPALMRRRDLPIANPQRRG